MNACRRLFYRRLAPRDTTWDDVEFACDGKR